MGIQVPKLMSDAISSEVSSQPALEPWDIVRDLMEGVLPFYDDSEVAGERVKEEIEKWTCGFAVVPEVSEAMAESFPLYDLPEDAAEDAKDEVNRWVNGYVEQCRCGMILVQCICP